MFARRTSPALPPRGFEQSSGRGFATPSDLMLRSSLESRDEILTSYGDRVRELQMIRSEMAHALKNPLASLCAIAMAADSPPNYI
jgi:hypothetical protein